MKRFIWQAIEIAKKGIGKTEHRPLVGCIILQGKKIIATAYHGERKRKHAEAIALEKAGNRAKGAEMIVTLEPCDFRGRTGSCTDKIIKHGIKKVTIGAIDQNPKAKGKAIKKLKKAGVKVEVLNSKEAIELNKAFNKWILTGKPFVLLKIAMSADGFISFGNGRRKIISCNASRKRVHELRNEFEAVLTGIGTVKKDNPRLTCRLGQGRNPTRIVLDPLLQIPLNARLLNENGKTIIFYKKGLRSKKKKFLKGKAVLLPATAKNNLFDLNEVLEKIGKRKIMSVLVEGGQKINTSFLKGNHADEIMFFISKKKLGKGLRFYKGNKNPKKLIEGIKIEKIGQDLMMLGKPKRIN